MYDCGFTKGNKRAVESGKSICAGCKEASSSGSMTRPQVSGFCRQGNSLRERQRPGSLVFQCRENVTKTDSVISGCWYTDEDDNTIADLARSLGVNLKFTSYTRYCIKE